MDGIEDAELMKTAKKIFKVVEADLRDRRGIRHEWDAVDEEIQKEIRETNVANILKVLKRDYGR